MTRYARRVDGNHAEIRDQLRCIPGMRVLDTAAMSGLGCDLLVFWQDRPALFVEIKAGPKEPLTDSEKRLKKMAEASSGFVRALAVEDVLHALGISTEPAPEEW